MTPDRHLVTPQSLRERLSPRRAVPLRAVLGGARPRGAGRALGLAPLGLATWLACAGLAAPAQAMPTAAPQAPATPAAGVSVPMPALGRPARIAPSETREGRAQVARDAFEFHQVLLGELELAAGRPQLGFELLMSAARQTGDERLYGRAMEAALSARQPDRALDAVRAWRSVAPGSRDALELQLQLLSVLRRYPEMVTPIQQWVAAGTPEQQASALQQLPSLVVSAGAQGAPTALQALVDGLAPARAAGQPAASRAAATAALARAALLAGEAPRALAWAREASELAPEAPSPALVALALTEGAGRSVAVPGAPLAAPATRPDDNVAKEAAALAEAWLARNGVRNAEAVPVALAQARRLAQTDRTQAAQQLLERVVAAHPQQTEAWMVLGAVRLLHKQFAAAEQALQRVVALAEQAPAAAGGATDDESPQERRQVRADLIDQAHLMLAQAADGRNDRAAADAYLQRVGNPKRRLEVAQARALLLARQGQTARGLALIDGVADGDGVDARARALARTQVFRELQDWPNAFAAHAEALRAGPEDADLLYAHAMLADRLKRFDEMERLLRRVIVLKPDSPHAYNALGYSLADRGVRLDEGAQLIQQALDRAPGDAYITDSLGWVEFRRGRTAEALRHLRAAYAVRQDAEIAAHLGEVLWVTGARDEARRIWREGRTREADNAVLNETLKRLNVSL